MERMRKSESVSHIEAGKKEFRLGIRKRG